MNDSIFNIPLKEAAKKLVIASDKKIKHTEALELVYKMSGYSSYINDGQKYINATREIEKALNKEIEKELIPLWNSEEKTSYVFNLIRLIERFFIFDDQTFLDLDYDIFEINVKKRLLDLSISTMDDDDSEEIIENFIEKNLIQNIPFDGNLLKNKAIQMNPKKFINWFKKCFKLRYMFFSESYYLDKIEKPINTNIKIEKSDIIFLSYESSLDKREKGSWNLFIECNFFFSRN